MKESLRDRFFRFQTEPSQRAAERYGLLSQNHVAALVVLLIVQWGLLTYASFRLSPTPDEFPHLCAGLDYLESGKFDLYSVNPPLVKVLAAWPAYAGGMRAPRDVPMADKLLRPEWQIGEAFADRQPQRAWWALLAGRQVAIALAVLGTLGVFALAYQCFGPAASLAASAMWASSPLTLGYGALLTMDVSGAALIAVASAAFFHWLSHGTPLTAFHAALWSALAILTKFTSLLLMPAFLFWWAAARWSAPRGATRYGGTVAIALVFGLSWLFVCAGYQFDRMFRPLGVYRFVSTSLAGDPADSELNARAADNRFAGTALADVPVPAPQAIVEGIDTQRRDFEKPSPAYLWGRWKEGGWWYYYLAGLVLKTPVAALGLIAIGTTVLRRRRDLWIPLVLIPALLMAAVSVQTNMNRHLRYALPVVPFLCVVASGAFTLPWRRWAAWTRRVLLAAACLLPLVFHPYGIGYVNLAVGGPRFGDRYLCHSSLDWNHGWIAAREWLRSRDDLERTTAVTVPRRWDSLRSAGFRKTKTSWPEVFADGQAEQVLLLIGVTRRMDLERWHQARFPAEKRMARLDAGIEVYRVSPRDVNRMPFNVATIEPRQR